MNFDNAQRVRRMCEQIARTLGQEEPPDIIDIEPEWTYKDGRIRIYDKGCWLDLAIKNSAGHFARALTVGGLTCKGDDDLFYANFDYIKSLYIASYFVPSAGIIERVTVCQN